MTSVAITAADPAVRTRRSPGGASQAPVDGVRASVENDPTAAFKALRRSVVNGPNRPDGVPRGGIKFSAWPCQKYMVKPGEKIDLATMPTEIVGRGDKPKYAGSNVIYSKYTNKEARKELVKLQGEIRDMLTLLYEQGTRSMLEQVDADNGGGKDGLIAHTYQANPEWFTCHNYKGPEGIEKEHLHEPNWRFTQHLGPAGTVTIQSRGPLGDIVFACKDEASKATRAALQNELELCLTYGLPLSEAGRYDPAGVARYPCTMFKTFLNGSKLEQAQRFVDRLEEKPKKLGPADLAGHPDFDATRGKFGDGLTRVNTPESPVYVIPGDNKDQARLVHAKIVHRILRDVINPKEPTTNPALSEADRAMHLKALLAELKAARDAS